MKSESDESDFCLAALLAWLCFLLYVESIKRNHTLTTHVTDHVESNVVGFEQELDWWTDDWSTMWNSCSVNVLRVSLKLTVNLNYNK